jgi:uncharacterized membrane protein YfcA
MNLMRVMRSRRHVAIGAVLGVAITLSLLTGARYALGSGIGAKWWPVMVAAALSGAVIGAILGVEADGELPDEGYDDVPDRRTGSRPDAP